MTLFTPITARLSTLRLCIVIGRGYHVEKEDDDAISSNFGALRDRKRRLALFQSIAKAQVSVDRWPLWLPTGLRALVTSNISAKAMSLDNGQDVSPERFVVEGFFESIKQALGDLKSLAVKTENSDADISIIEYEIPLSLEDARLFMVAFGRLAPAERNKLLPKVLSEIQTSIAKIYEKEESLVCENKDISGFIARLVTLCSNLTIWTSYTDLWDRFNEFVASNQPFEMPSFVNRGDWYRSGRCYMGLFSDWESAVPPFLGDASAESVAVANAAVGKAVASILDISFRMGFVAAKNDKGHLLFSAWNAIGNMPIWDPRRNDKSRNNSLDQLLAQVQTAKEGSLDLPGIILQIRDEICKLHFDVESIGGTESSFPLTLKLAGAGERAASSPAQVKKSLKAALAVGESFMNNLLEHEDESLEIFSTLEALSVYITFAVASHTKSGDDIFSTAHVRSCILRQKRARGYSSESERDPSDLESCESDESGDEDAASKLQSRLHEACSDFGAAPTHPDWLDKSCNLQPGIAASEALDASRTAVRALSKLLASSFYRHKKSLQQALDGIIREQKKDKNDGKAALAMKLIALLTRYDSESRYLGSCFDEPDEDEVPEPFECLSSVFGTDEDILSQALRLCSDDPFVEVKEAWCPNAAQRILGRFYSSNSDISERWLSGDLDVHSSPAELRVDGQWEVLLGAALASSCRGISQFPKDLLPSEVSEALSNAESWRKLCETAINCLMPAAALLRFGLARTGRSPHPLALEEEQSEEVFENKFHHFEISERIPVSITASKQLRETVAEGLGLMARYCAQCAGDSPVSLTCHAVATNLMVDGKLFEELRGLEACRFAFTTLSELEAMSEGPNTRQASNTDVLPFVNQQLTGIIEFWGRRDVHSPEGIAKTLTADKATPTVGTDFSRLLALLGLCSSQIDTIAENNIITCGVLSLLDKKEEEAATYSSFEARWHWGNRNDFPVFTMVSLLCRDASHANLQTRACLGMILSQLASRDCASSTENTASDSFISTLLLKAFNSVAADQYEGLLSECVQMLDETCDGKFQRETCSLLALLLNARPGVPKFSKVDATVTFLLKSAPNWLNKKSKGREHVLDLLILYGCHKSSLPQIGSLLLSILTSSEHEDLEPMARYFRFLQGLRAPLSRKEKSKDDSRSSSKGTQAEEDASKRDPPPRSCSYAQRSGFHGQHWYNCYTCGLTWDKGCCTLCALVCHKGHDVSYSRYSSFFCDCGAESEEDRSRSSCKCLSTLARERVQELFEKEGWIVPSDPEPCHDLASGTEGNDSPKFYIDIANASFPKQVKFSVDNLVAETSKLGWLDLLFGVLRKSFNAWCGSGTSNKMLQDSPSTVDFEPDECDGYEYFRQSLQKRIGKVVEIEPLNSAPLVPIRAAKSNSFQVKFSGTSNERLKRSKNEIARASVVADNRGRLVIAEPCSLLFCSMGNAVNMKHVTNAVDIPLSRSSVCILGSATVRFNVVGMQLCPENDRHLLVWGASEACIAVLKDSHNDTERMIYLSLDLNPTECENDYIVKSCWIPGSQTCIAIGCGRFVSIFDIARADKDNRAVPVVSFGLGSDANLRDIEVTPAYALNQSTNFSCDSRPETAATLFILLENGRVYSVDLDYDTEGKPTARGDQQFEANESISFPLAGVRSYGGSAPGLPGSQQKTLGDGSFLTYLSQSHLLLYKSTSSCVLALTLGITGKINGSFELLPHTLSPEILGTASTGGYSIGGPYNYFTELGMSQYDDGSHYFRVACVGRSFRTNQPKLLCVEFNEIHVKVKEISWESDSIGLGLSLYSSFEGVCSFSLPCRCEDADVPDSNDGSRFAERGFLCAVTSNGCLLLYGEENGLNMSSTADISRRRTDAKISRNRNKSEKTMVPDRSVLASNPITLFERLKLVSDEMTDEVVFGGDGLGR